MKFLKPTTEEQAGRFAASVLRGAGLDLDALMEAGEPEKLAAELKSAVSGAEQAHKTIADQAAVIEQLEAKVTAKDGDIAAANQRHSDLVALLKASGLEDEPTAESIANWHQNESAKLNAQRGLPASKPPEPERTIKTHSDGTVDSQAVWAESLASKR